MQYTAVKNTMKLAIETYANLTNTTFQNVVNECNKENKVVITNIQKLMFATI